MIDQSIKEFGLPELPDQRPRRFFAASVSFDIHMRLKNCANQGFEYQNDGDDFVVFRP
jgi:hypothetical protein